MILEAQTVADQATFVISSGLKYPFLKVGHGFVDVPPPRIGRWTRSSEETNTLWEGSLYGACSIDFSFSTNLS